jgi:hypothetical protein
MSIAVGSLVEWERRVARGNQTILSLREGTVLALEKDGKVAVIKPPNKFPSAIACMCRG